MFDVVRFVCCSECCELSEFVLRYVIKLECLSRRLDFRFQGEGHSAVLERH